MCWNKYLIDCVDTTTNATLENIIWQVFPMIMVDINITLDYKSFQMLFYAKPINQYWPKNKKLHKTNAKLVMNARIMHQFG